MNRLLVILFGATLITACAAPVTNERDEKTVFVTKESFKNDLGGLSGADAKCQTEADHPESIVKSGTYLAWLSDGTESPNTRFAKSSFPYVLPDGTKIAEDYSDLTDGSILHPINVDATGKLIKGLQRFWTDTNSDGTAAQEFKPDYKFNSCNAWTGSDVYDASAITGTTVEIKGSWTYKYLAYCKYRGREKYRLACFEQ